VTVALRYYAYFDSL